MIHTVSPYSEAFAIAAFTAPTLNNRNVFDYHNHIFSNGLDRITREFQVSNFALEQTFFNNKAGIELAFDDQSYRSEQDFFFAGGDGTSHAGPYDIYMDINVYLLNGQLNPNLGRAYTRVRSPRKRFRTTDRETFRATAFAEFDFNENEGWFKHLGRHRITGLFNDYRRDLHTWDIRDSSESNEFDMTSAQTHALGGGRRWINPMAYLSDSNIGLQSIDDVRLRPITIERYAEEFEFNFLYGDTTPGSNPNANNGMPGERVIKEGRVFVKRFLQTENVIRNEIEATAFAWQSYFLDDHIVGLYGRRTDDTVQYNRAGTAEAGVPTRLPDLTWNPEFTRLSTTPSLDETGDTETWSVIGRYPEALLGDLPGRMSLQAHYAESENFNPIGARNTPLGDPIGQPTGTTKEYGILAGFSDNKFTIKLNWFETELVDESAGLSVNVAGSAIGRINAHRDAELNLGIPWEDQLSWVDGGPENYPYQSYDDFYTAMLSTIPQRALDIFQPMQVDDNGDGQWDQYEFTNTVTNIQATTDRRAEGFEVEFTANPTPGWRLLANISKQETISTDTANLLSELLEGYVADVRSLRLDELETDPRLQTDSEPWSVVLGGAILGPVRGAKALDNTVSQEQREWRITAVSNYQVQEGGLKGFGFGGAVRWEDEAATGYVFQVEPETGVPVPDVNRPFYDDGLFSGDLWFSYGKRILDGKVDWSVRLNVRNLVGESDDIPVKTNPDGRVAVIRIPNPRTLYLTNTFKF